jgi:hypothetical protein
MGEATVGEEAEMSFVGEVGWLSLDESFVRFFLRNPSEGMRSGAEVACSAVWHCHSEILSLCLSVCSCFSQTGTGVRACNADRAGCACEWPGRRDRYKRDRGQLVQGSAGEPN